MATWAALRGHLSALAYSLTLGSLPPDEALTYPQVLDYSTHGSLCCTFLPPHRHPFRIQILSSLANQFGPLCSAAAASAWPKELSHPSAIAGLNRSSFCPEEVSSQFGRKDDGKWGQTYLAWWVQKLLHSGNMPIPVWRSVFFLNWMSRRRRLNWRCSSWCEIASHSFWVLSWFGPFVLLSSPFILSEM